MFVDGQIDEAALLALDDELAQEGVPARERPDAAVLRWLQIAKGPTDLGAVADAFNAAFAKLHPSVDFTPRPFAVLCASARGTAYEVNPPVLIGNVRVDPMKSVRIGPAELNRIYTADVAAFWELHYQAADAFDLFMCGLDFHPNQPMAAAMHSVGLAQLQGSARQLIAVSHDAALPQAMSMAVEQMVKAVLHENGVGLIKLKGLGHNIPGLCAELAKVLPGTHDADVIAAAAGLPNYVSVRYDPPNHAATEAQELFRRALFISAEALRRTRAGSIYWQMAADPAVPPRTW